MSKNKKVQTDLPKTDKNPQWGRMLTKKELIDLVERIYAKQKDKKEK